MADPNPTPRRRLPDVALAPPGGGAAVPLRVPRHAAVLVLLDAPPDEGTRDYLGELAGAASGIAGWDGRVIVVVGGESGPALAALGLPFPVLADPGGAVAAAAGVAAPALVVADQWGEVHSSTAVGPGRPWPRPAELEKWAQFLAIRCAG